MRKTSGLSTCSPTQTVTLRTLYAIVFIGHGRRRIVHVSVTRHPTAEWVWRQLLEATPWGMQPRHLIRDRDRCYGSDFVARASSIGIHAILTPVRAPNANAVAERVIGTLRRECLDQMIVLNERHLSRVLREYVEHYNTMRPHRTLESGLTAWQSNRNRDQRNSAQGCPASGTRRSSKRVRMGRMRFCHPTGVHSECRQIPHRA